MPLEGKKEEKEKGERKFIFLPLLKKILRRKCIFKIHIPKAISENRLVSFYKKTCSHNQFRSIE